MVNKYAVYFGKIIPCYFKLKNKKIEQEVRKNFRAREGSSLSLTTFFIPNAESPQSEKCRS